LVVFLEHDCNVGEARTFVKTFVLERLNYVIVDPCHLLSAECFFLSFNLLKAKKKGGGGEEKQGCIPVHAMKVYRWSRGVASLILDLSTRRMCVFNFMPQPLYSQDRTLVPIK
jgi:hypothetical protein